MPRYPCPITKKKDIYPSVTEIISDCTDKSGALTQWASNMTVEWIKENVEWNEEYDGYNISHEQLSDARFHFREVSQKAMDIGSEVHDMIENYFLILMTGKGKERTARSEEAANAFYAFQEWIDENDIKPIEVEKTVYRDRWAGRLDFYGYFNGKLYVIDWKSSKAHYPEMRYQVAAYRSALNQEIAVEILTNKKYEGDRSGEIIRNRIEGCGVLRLDKETGLPDFKDHSKSYDFDLAVFSAMVELYFLRHPRIRAKFLKNKEEI